MVKVSILIENKLLFKMFLASLYTSKAIFSSSKLPRLICLFLCVIETR